MKQYFYLVMVDNEPVKIELQEYKALKFGKRALSANKNSRVQLYRQEITTTGKIELYKNL